jgi:2-methylisocitrate lyase-like PEP mutase family enzyme
MTQASKLRAALSEPGMVIAPGAYDGLTAMLVAQAGFAAVYMTGAGTSVSHGYPDFGLLTATEMVANAARMVRAVDVPVIADADTGYGNELNVVRTVRDYEQAGVAGIHIEDQVSPSAAATSTTRRSSRGRIGSPRSAPPRMHGAIRTS